MRERRKENPHRPNHRRDTRPPTPGSPTALLSLPEPELWGCSWSSLATSCPHVWLSGQVESRPGLWGEDPGTHTRLVVLPFWLPASCLLLALFSILRASCRALLPCLFPSLSPSLFFFFFLFFCFLGPHMWCMEVPRLGVKSELQLLACTEATATPDPSCLCDLHHSSRQHRVLSTE